jgi:outer membrane receptor protein involved in Fe transport
MGNGPSFLRVDRHDRLVEMALFGEATVPLGHGVSATAGGRVFNSRTRVASLITTAGGAPPASFRGALHRAGFVPKLLLAYQRQPSWLVYASAAKGFRSPGFNTTAAPGETFVESGPGQPARRYDDDELWSYELGAYATLFADRLSLRAAVFRAVWRDVQSDQLLPSGLEYTANIGRAVIRGFEAESAYRRGRLSLRAAVLLNDPELVRADPGFPIRPELALAAVPRASGSILGHYSWPLSSWSTADLDARLAYVGPSHLTFDAQTAPRMGGYLTSRVAGSVAWRRWRLTLAVENVTNAYGDTFAYGNPFILRTTRQVTPLRPRLTTLTFEGAL